ncbi:MAG: hypothetical protein GC160_01350 [Acidobacteria bacterium]|nr:hypothetical protein [Acidobacteriota bacterium]
MLRREERLEQVWNRTLEQIPTHFGRLAYLASLRDHNSGRYRHHGLAQSFGEEEAAKILRLSHETVFSEWLNFRLQEQHEDLDRYLNSMGQDRRSVLETWGTLAPYRVLAPAAAGGAERLLYETDLEIILELLRAESADSRSV